MVESEQVHSSASTLVRHSEQTLSIAGCYNTAAIDRRKQNSSLNDAKRNAHQFIKRIEIQHSKLVEMILMTKHGLRAFPMNRFHLTE